MDIKKRLIVVLSVFILSLGLVIVTPQVEAGPTGTVVKAVVTKMAARTSLGVSKSALPRVAAKSVTSSGVGSGSFIASMSNVSRNSAYGQGRFASSWKPTKLAVSYPTKTFKAVANNAIKPPDFLVSRGGTIFPVPKGVISPTAVVNSGGKITGKAFTGGKGGVNRQVDTMRIMNATPAKGGSPSYSKGYVKYTNAIKQGVDPYTGRTISNTASHFPIK